MSAGPHTVKEAAVRLLLGEMGPLLEKAETAAKTLNDAHVLIERDLEQFGQLVTSLEQSLDSTRREVAQIARDVQKAKAMPMQGAAKQPGKAVPGAVSAKAMIAAIFGCGIVSALIAVAGMAAFNKSTLEDARIGRAVTNALRYIDADTKQKLEAAILKASS